MGWGCFATSGGGITRPAAELFVILFLGAVLLAASFPFYASLARAPEDLFFGPGVFVISQASVDQPLTEDLASAIQAEPWAVAVSPEVYALVGWSGEAVVVRGVQLEPFLAMEGLALGGPLGPEFLLVGERLAARLGVGAGDPILLPGSTHPVLVEAQVDGILSAGGAVGDEMLLDLGRARIMAGLGGSAVSFLRAEVQDAESLVAYLAATRRDVVVAGEGESHLVQGGAVLDDRVGSLVLTNPDLGRELGRGYIGSFAQHSGNSLSVLVLGMEGLTMVLLGVMMASTLARFWMERRREVGVLRALGGGMPAALRLFGRKLFGLGVPATAAGLLAGIGVGLLLATVQAYAFFGHTLPYRLHAVDLLFLGVLSLGAFGVIVLLSLTFLLRQPPRELLAEGPDPSWGDTQESPLDPQPPASAPRADPAPNLKVDIQTGNAPETVINGDHLVRPRS
ncbi:MAG: ABC transporter permease [Thermoplasmata archaeon]